MTTSTTAPKSRAIIMTADSVRAIYCRAKSQSRRLIKPQPVFDGTGWTCGGFKGLPVDYFLTESSVAEWLFHEHYGTLGTPYGSVYADGSADELWVKETWAPCGDAGAVWFKAGVPVYHAGRWTGEWAPDDPVMGLPLPADVRWRSPRFMPRWASRFTLQLCDVRIEQLGAISEDDAKAEGVLPSDECCDADHGFPTRCWESLHDLAYRLAFVRRWKSIHGNDAWVRDRERWVWVLEFRLLSPDLETAEANA